MVGNLSGMTHDWWYIPIFAGCQDNLLVNVAEPSALLCYQMPRSFQHGADWSSLFGVMRKMPFSVLPSVYPWHEIHLGLILKIDET